MNYAPIVLFTYNRLNHTRQTVEALKRNYLAGQSDIIIYSDFAKGENEDITRVVAVREYLQTITGFRNKTIIERDTNLGLAASIIDGVSSVVNKYQKIIVIEDDLVTSPFFLTFMNNALDLFEHKNEVISIHGYCYPLKKRLARNYFLKGADCWGWATWSRGWQIFEPDGKKLLQQLVDRDLIREFDFNNSYPYSKMLSEQINGKNNSWAIRWYASAFLQNKLTLYPKTSYVANIGNDNSGTHSADSRMFDIELNTNFDVNDFEIEIKESEEARALITNYFRGLKINTFKRQIKHFFFIK